MKKFVFIIIIILNLIFITKKGFSMEINTPAFKSNTRMPTKFTCQGENVSPGIEIFGTPEEAKSLVLIVDDPDTPRGLWNHWAVYNISPDTQIINEGSVPGIECITSSQEKNWSGPCPPSGTHRYIFKIYALDTTLNLNKDSTYTDLRARIQDHIIDQAQTIGIYKKLY